MLENFKEFYWAQKSCEFIGSLPRYPGFSKFTPQTLSSPFFSSLSSRWKNAVFSAKHEAIWLRISPNLPQRPIFLKNKKKVMQKID